MALARITEQARLLHWLNNVEIIRLEETTRRRAAELVPLEPYGGLILKALLRQLAISREDTQLFMSLRSDSVNRAWEVLDQWLGEDSEAILTTCQKLPDHYFEHDSLKYCYAIALHRTGHEARALEMMQDHLVRNPRDGYFNYAAGNVCRSIGERDRAISYYRVALLTKASPLYSVHNNLGLTFIELKEFRKAKYHLTKAIMLDPEDIAAILNLIDLYIAWGKFGIARVWCNVGLALYSDDSDLNERYNKVRWQRDQRDK